MPKGGFIGESGSDRATNKMEKWMSRSQTQHTRELTLLEQFQKYYHETWKEEIKKAQAEYENSKKNS